MVRPSELVLVQLLLTVDIPLIPQPLLPYYDSHLIIFYYVAFLKSFTKAALHLHYSKAYVSKQINELEQAIGILLFHRSTRTIELTPAGESIFEHATLIVQEYQHVQNTIASLQNKAQGLLRITAPPTYTDCILARNLPRFLNHYPQIMLEMNITGQLVNLVDQKIDVAIRLTHEPPPDRIAKKIGTYQEVVCASPEYLKIKGVPLHPKELLNHDCLVYAYDKYPANWPFLIDSEIKPFSMKPKLAVNNSKVLLEAAVNGLGIVRLPSYLVQDSIEQKKLKPVLSNFYPAAIPVCAIYAHSRIIPEKIRVFLTFMQNVHHQLHQNECEGISGTSIGLSSIPC